MVEEPRKIEYADQHGNKVPVILAVVVGLVAAAISVWGVNSNGLTAGIEIYSAPQAVPGSVRAPEDKEEGEKLLAIGSRLHQSRCAACHSVDTKSIGPSYREISRRYGESVDIPGNTAPGVNNQISSSVLSSLGLAATHPKNSWDGYEQGPKQQLTEQERRAIAFWIFTQSLNKDAGDE